MGVSWPAEGVVSRIRTIKPELPHSETLGRVSRDARLLFVLLWTVADDAGRARANARLLASLLFPFDADAPAAVPEWLAELEAVDCIRRYTVDRTEYLEIPRWTSHQKIDRPGPSRHPAPPSVPSDVAPEAVIVPYPDNSTSPREDSRGFASLRRFPAISTCWAYQSSDVSTSYIPPSISIH